MTTPRPLPLLLVLCLPWAGGCAAVEARNQDGATEFYAGTRENVAQLRDPDPDDRVLRRLMYAVDLPFSAVVETFLIPFDYLRRKKDTPD